MVGPAMYNGGYLESLQIRITQGHGFMPYIGTWVRAHTSTHVRARQHTMTDVAGYLSTLARTCWWASPSPASVLDFKEIPVG